jgi:hypothetical protein
MKICQAIICLRYLYWTNILRTISVVLVVIIIIIIIVVIIIIRDLIPDDGVQDGPQNVGSVQTPDVADRLRRLCQI